MNSLFSGNHRKPFQEETYGEVSSFPDNVFYNLSSQVFSESFSKIILSLPRAFSPAMASNTIPLKNLNYLQAKFGGAETRIFSPISHIGGFRSNIMIDLFINHFRSHWLNYSEGQQ